MSEIKIKRMTMKSRLEQIANGLVQDIKVIKSIENEQDRYRAGISAAAKYGKLLAEFVKHGTMGSGQRIYGEHIDKLSEITGLSSDDLRNSRTGFASVYRGFVMRYLRDCGFTLSQIAKVSERDHSTVFYAIRRDLQYEAPEVKENYKRYQEYIRAYSHRDAE